MAETYTFSQDGITGSKFTTPGTIMELEKKTRNNRNNSSQDTGHQVIKDSMLER